jgi:hypothetical protein
MNRISSLTLLALGTVRLTKVTAAGVEKLKQALPNCKIRH